MSDCEVKIKALTADFNLTQVMEPSYSCQSSGYPAANHCQPPGVPRQEVAHIILHDMMFYRKLFPHLVSFSSNKREQLRWFIQKEEVMQLKNGVQAQSPWVDAQRAPILFR